MECHGSIRERCRVEAAGTLSHTVMHVSKFRSDLSLYYMSPSLKMMFTGRHCCRRKKSGLSARNPDTF